MPFGKSSRSGSLSAADQHLLASVDVNVHSPKSLLEALAQTLVAAEQNAFPITENGSSQGSGETTDVTTTADVVSSSSAAIPGVRTAAGESSISNLSHAGDKFVFKADDLRTVHSLLSHLIDLSHPTQNTSIAVASHAATTRKKGHDKGSVAPLVVDALTTVEAILTLPVDDALNAKGKSVSTHGPLKKPSAFLFILRNFESILLHDVRGAMLMAGLLANICSACHRNNLQAYRANQSYHASMGAVRHGDPNTSLHGNSSQVERETTGEGSVTGGLRKRDRLRRLLTSDAHDVQAPGLESGSTERAPAVADGASTCADTPPIKEPAVTQAVQPLATPQHEQKHQQQQQRAHQDPTTGEDQRLLNQVRIIRAVLPAAAVWELLMVAAQRYKNERRTLHFLLTVMADAAYMPDIVYRHTTLKTAESVGASEESSGQPPVTHSATAVGSTVTAPLISDADCKALVQLVLPSYTEAVVVETWLTALCNITALHPFTIPSFIQHNLVESVERLLLFHGNRDSLVQRGLEVLSNVALEVMEETSTIAKHQRQQQQQHHG